MFQISYFLVRSSEVLSRLVWAVWADYESNRMRRYLHAHHLRDKLRSVSSFWTVLWQVFYLQKNLSTSVRLQRILTFLNLSDWREKNTTLRRVFYIQFAQFCILSTTQSLFHSDAAFFVCMYRISYLPHQVDCVYIIKSVSCGVQSVVLLRG